MTRLRWVAPAAWVAAVVMLGACDRLGDRIGGRLGDVLPGGGSRLEANWTGADTGRIVMAASAEWCEAGKYLRIDAMQGDTGIALAVFPADTALAGRYPLALSADSSRPAAAVAFRWLDATTIAGFRSDSGIVMLRRGSRGDLSGEFTADGRLSGGRARPLHLVGQFRRITVRSAPDDCPIFLPEPADSALMAAGSGRRGAGVNSPHGDDLL